MTDPNIYVKSKLVWRLDLVDLENYTLIQNLDAKNLAFVVNDEYINLVYSLGPIN